MRIRVEDKDGKFKGWAQKNDSMLQHVQKTTPYNLNLGEKK